MFSLALLSLVGASSAAEPEKPWKFDAAELQPFWLGTTMHGESVLFIKEGEGGAKGKLLLTPTKILKVTSSSGEIVYESGKDYVWQPGSKEIVLPAGSKIIWKTPQDLRRPAKSQKYALTHRDGNGEILFGATHEYHDMQTLVTYEHDQADWKNPTPVFPSKELSEDRQASRGEKAAEDRPAGRQHFDRLQRLGLGQSCPPSAAVSGFAGA